MTKNKILIIDDDHLFCSMASEYLSDLKIEIMTAHTGSEGLNYCRRNLIDIVILDQKLPDTSGSVLYKSILSENNLTKIIFITAFPDLKNAVNAVRNGAYDYISKPFEPDELKLAVQKALETIHLEKVVQIHEYKQRVETNRTNIIGKSDAVKNLIQMINHAASSNAPVIITGETGTGKNLAAREIHNKSLCKNEPYITVNCSALPENLIEAELFGVEKGAYTGADRTRKGLFELADGGTLLLDEIGEIPMNVQSKLLGVLDEKKIKRIGGLNKIDINVRVIAATNVEIEKALSEKTFRQDLYFRLSIIRIHIPPLKERYYDIPDIINNQIKEITGKTIIKLGKNEEEKLIKYSWPGNIRELHNLTERAIILRKSDEIYPSQFLSSYNKKKYPDLPSASNEEALTLFEAEKLHILKILKLNSGNYTKTSQALDISRSTLMRKLKIYNQNKQDKS